MRGPLLELESHLLGHQPVIERWFRSQWRETPPPFYASVDLRNAGFKVAPVDTNLFPAGFNNLDSSLLPLAIQAVEQAITRACPDAIGVLLIPENHTRNLYYLESVAALEKIVKRAGYQVRVGTLSEDITEATTFDLPSGSQLTIEPVTRADDRISVRDFSPCIVLLNNDFSGGNPPILEGLEQTIAPPLGMSWSFRLKSEHFGFYSTVAREFAELINIDPWLVDPIFRNCGEINFRTREGEDCLASNVEATLSGIRK
ncbi:MAG: glutamate--cysteine ligase, partial [Gammaproteobacteria bacterium]